MPVVRQYRIFRSDLKNNPNVLYLFGDNAKRQGFGGQAHEMRGEPNAVGIRTKWSPDNTPQAFFNDSRLREFHGMLTEDMRPVITALYEGKIVVIPSDGLGTGLSELPTRAPKCNTLLAHFIDSLYAIEPVN